MTSSFYDFYDTKCQKVLKTFIFLGFFQQYQKSSLFVRPAMFQSIFFKISFSKTRITLLMSPQLLLPFQDQNKKFVSSYFTNASNSLRISYLYNAFHLSKHFGRPSSAAGLLLFLLSSGKCRENKKKLPKYILIPLFLFFCLCRK